MKITKAQLRKLIREGSDPGGINRITRLINNLPILKVALQKLVAHPGLSSFVNKRVNLKEKIDEINSDEDPEWAWRYFLDNEIQEDHEYLRILNTAFELAHPANLGVLTPAEINSFSYFEDSFTLDKEEGDFIMGLTVASKLTSIGEEVSPITSVDELLEQFRKFDKIVDQEHITMYGSPRQTSYAGDISNPQLAMMGYNYEVLTNRTGAATINESIAGSHNKACKMKITRRQLRRLIAEAFTQKVPLFGPHIKKSKYANKIKGNLDHVSPDELSSLRDMGRSWADAYDDLEAEQKANLDTLADTEPNVERSIWQALGSQEPMTTVEEEEAFFAGQDDYLQDISDFNLNEVFNYVFVEGGRDEKLLKQLGFHKVSDFPHLQPDSPDYEEWGYMLEEQGELLGKPVKELMFIDSDEGNKMFDKIIEYLNDSKSIQDVKMIQTDYSGGTKAYQPVDNVKKMILVDYYQGGYGVITL